MTISIKPATRAIIAGVLAALLLIGVFLIGTTQSKASSNSNSRQANLTVPGRLTVTGSGTVTGVPNQLILSMGVQASGATVSSALYQANGAANRVIDTLKREGVSAANIATSNLSIYPNYSPHSQYPIGYQVSEQLTATLTNLKRAGTQIQAAATAGGNATTVDSVALNLTDTGNLLARARAAAVLDAQKKATQFAGALHEQLGAVISISDQSSFSPYPVYGGNLSAAAPSHVPVSPGTQQVSVQITVVYSVG